MLRLAVLILAFALQGLALRVSIDRFRPHRQIVTSTPAGPWASDRTSYGMSTPVPSHRPSTAEQTATPSSATKQQSPLSTAAPLARPSTGGLTSNRRPSTPAPYSGSSIATHRVSTLASADHRPSSAAGATGAFHTTGETSREPFTTVMPIGDNSDAWKYRVLDGAGRTCIRMSLHAVLSVQYKTVDNETRSVEVPVPVPETDASGFCHEEARLSLAWSNFELRWTFAKIETNDTWMLTGVEVDFKKSEAPFENALIEDGGTVRLETGGQVQAPLGRVFTCPRSAIAFSNTTESQNVTLRVLSLRVQPFDGGDALSEPVTCTDAESLTLTPGSSPPPTADTASQTPSYQATMRNMPYEAPTVQPYVYKKVNSNMVKVYPPKKFMRGMNGDPSDPMGSMLWSWYMSGFYTGYYQALQQGKKF